VAILGRGSNAALLLGAWPVMRGAGVGLGSLRATAILAAAAAPVVLFDQAVGAVPTSAGVNVWLGNNAWSRQTLSLGTDEIAMDPDGEARDIVRVAEAAEGRPLSKAEMNAWWARRALREMGDDVGAASLHFAKKAALVLSAPDTGGNRDVDAEREFSTWLRTAPVSSAWILVLGAAGCIAAWRATRGTDAIALAALGGVAALVVVFPLTRYRMPLVPTAAVLAGVGAAAVLSKRADGRARGAAVATLVVLAAVSYFAETLRSAARPESWTNLGLAAIDTGVGDAEVLLRRAAKDGAAFPTPSLVLANRALGRGDAAQALRDFDAAIRAAGDRSTWAGVARDAAVGRCRALAALGRSKEALEFLDRARERFPNDADLAAEGVFLALDVGDRLDAVRRLVDAQALDANAARVREAETALRNSKR
jgi:tetratricopeptide (TPR) repeat protein